MSSNLQLIFKEATKSSGQRNVNMRILLDTLRSRLKNIFFNKKMFVVRMEIGDTQTRWGHDEIQFLIFVESKRGN